MKFETSGDLETRSAYCLDIAARKRRCIVVLTMQLPPRKQTSSHDKSELRPPGKIPG